MKKIGIIGYYNKSGLGNLIKNFRKNLDIECQFVIKHPIKGTEDDIPGEVAYGDLEPTIEQFEEFLSFKPTTVIVVETPFNWDFLPLMKKRGIRIVYIPMTDCVRFDEIKYKECVDVWLMLNHLGEGLAHYAGLKNINYVPYAVDTEYFQFKERTGNLFLHNAGYYELIKGQVDAHKGTDLVINAFLHKRLRDKIIIINSMTDIENGINFYDCNHIFLYGTGNILKSELNPTCIGADGKFKFPENFVFREKRGYSEQKDLYEVGDIYVAPSRWEGLGLPLYESMACGMLLITTEGPPMHEIPISSNFRVTSDAFTIPHGTGLGYAVRIPALIQKIEYVASMDSKEIREMSYKNRSIIEGCYSWKVLKDKYIEVIMK